MPAVAASSGIVFTSEVVQVAERFIGAFSRLSQRSTARAAADFVHLSKSFKRARILSRYAGVEQ
jgi:hypothetical protein